MMYRALQMALVAALVLMGTRLMAGEPVDPALSDRLSKKLSVPAMGLTVESVATSQLPGLYEVQFANGGPLVYATEDGSHFVLGDLYSVGPQGFVNLAEQRRDGERMEALDGIAKEYMLVFSPEVEPRA